MYKLNGVWVIDVVRKIQIQSICFGIGYMQKEHFVKWNKKRVTFEFYVRFQAI